MTPTPKKIKPVCIICGGEVMLIEGEFIDGDSPGYGYGVFQCQQCGTESSYYNEGLKEVTDEC